MSKENLKSKAILLRKQGYSYSDIKKRIGVSKSTLSDWLTSIPYTPNEFVKQKIIKARVASGVAKGKILIDSINKAGEMAKKDVGAVNKRDLFMLGLGIYIGEGAKTHNIVRISNSDPRIIRFMVVWFKKVFGLKEDNLFIRLHLYPDLDIKTCEQFWSKNTGVPVSHFFKCSIDVRTNKKKQDRKKLSYGTAHLCVKSNGNQEFGVKLSRRICACMNEMIG